MKRVAELGSRNKRLKHMYEALRGVFYFNPGQISISVDGGQGATYEKTWVCAITSSQIWRWA